MVGKTKNPKQNFLDSIARSWLMAESESANLVYFDRIDIY